MLIVNNNSSNEISMSLSENQYDISITGTTSTGYTMDLINETTNEIFSGITLTTTNSAYTSRYNQFTFVLTGLTSEDYSSTYVYLKDDGFYKYKCYYEASSERELIEQGFMKVVGVADIVTTIALTDEDDSDYFIL